MRLDPFVRDYRTYMDEFVEALEAKGTRFYLDTSVLMWLIRIGSDARKDFISWCTARPAGTVLVPVWAAHELHRHVAGGTVRQNVQKILDEVKAKYDEFVRLAVERADDATCSTKGFAGRANYVGEVELALGRLHDLTGVVSSDDRQIYEATDEVIGFINQRLLATDLGPLLEKLSHTGSLRYSHFVPPGFHDKKEENRYGDVIIWEELVADLLAAGNDGEGKPRHALLISRDKKTDWVSSAPLVRNGCDARTEKPNRDLELDVTLPIPLLRHEFSSRAKGGRLYVSHPGFLASAIDYAARRQGQTSSVKHWLAALHRPTFLERLAALKLVSSAGSASVGPVSHAQTQPNVATSDGGEIQILPPVERTTAPSLSNISVTDVTKISVNDDVGKFERSMPADQPAQVAEWTSLLSAGELSPQKLGRVFAVLSIKGIAGWSEQLPSIIHHLQGAISAGDLNVLVLSLICTAYFDQHGDLLPRPPHSLGQVVVTLESNPALEPAFNALRNFLTVADAKLPYVPGTKQKVNFTVKVVQGVGNAPRKIQDIRVGDQSAFSDPAPTDSPRLLSTLLGRVPGDACTGLELRTLIAREYLIPMGCLKDENDSKKLTWPETAGLVALDTGSEGGLNTLAEDEESYD